MKTRTKILAVLAFLIFCSIGLADELLVPSQYPTIQSAIDAAFDGDEVIVAPGTYTGPGNWDIDFLGKAITVKSKNGPQNCIIDIGASQSNWHNGFYLNEGECETSVIEGFTIKGGYTYLGGGIYCEDSSPTIKNCIITKNTGGWGGGITCYKSNAIVGNCLIVENEGWDAAGGIYCRDSNLKITNCTVSNNISYHGGGILCQHASLTINNCILWGNSSGQIADRDNDSVISVSYSNIEGGWPGQGNIDEDPYFAFSTDYHIIPPSPCIDAGDPDYTAEPNETDLDGNPRIIGERIDMGAYEYNPNSPSIAVSASLVGFSFVQDCPKPDQQILLIRNCGDGTLHWEIVEDCDWLETVPTNGVSTNDINEVTLMVDPNGLPVGYYIYPLRVLDPNAVNSPVTVLVSLHVGVLLRVPEQFTTIQAAINAAVDYDMVLVADGVYTGEGNRDIDFLGKAIIVRSENGPNNCIIDCNGTEAEPHRGFYFHNSEDAHSEDAHSVVAGFSIRNGYARYDGGGISCQGGSPTITNCNITGNSAKYDGGGIYCDFESSPTISYCTITGNSQGGGIYCFYSNPTITGCTVSQNGTDDGRGGGIYCRGGSPTITNCTISGNGPWGRPPSAGGGIYVDGEQASPTITNCTITGNRGGITCGWDSSPIINNCTISANRDEGIYCRDSNPTITNCIITGNLAEVGRGDGISCEADSLIITNCTIAKNQGRGIYCWRSGSLIIKNSILWGNEAPDYGPQIYLKRNNNVWVSFTNVQGGQADVYVGPGCTLNWGPGNIDNDPCFVELGYWADANDPNIIVEPNDPNAVWVNGDYHLKSEGWSWDIKRSRWTYDDVTSRCIDAGNPGSPLGDELLSIPDDPNNIWGQNLRINMGAYGGTSEASIPPYDWAILGDLTNNGLVNLKDYAFQAADWLNFTDQQPGDLNRDSLINISDLVLLVEDWLRQTTWHE